MYIKFTRALYGYNCLEKGGIDGLLLSGAVNLVYIFWHFLGGYFWLGSC